MKGIHAQFKGAYRSRGMRREQQAPRHRPGMPRLQRLTEKAD